MGEELSRAQFLKRVAVLGLGIPALGALLARSGRADQGWGIRFDDTHKIRHDEMDVNKPLYFEDDTYWSSALSVPTSEATQNITLANASRRRFRFGIIMVISPSAGGDPSNKDGAICFVTETAAEGFSGEVSPYSGSNAKYKTSYLGTPKTFGSYVYLKSIVIDNDNNQLTITWDSSSGTRSVKYATVGVVW